MNRIDPSGGMDNALRLIHAMAASSGVSVPELDEAWLLSALTELISTVRSSDILTHGIRVESMFAYVAGALGHCAAIKAEDSGSLYWQESRVKVPDFRVITHEGDEFFVEVKNCRKPMNPHYEYRFKADYFTGLINYARIFQRDLKIAIYWSRMGLWTLVPAEAFVQGEASYSLSFEDCVKASQMRILGDAMVGTSPPLTLWLDMNELASEPTATGAEVDIQITGVKLFCNGSEIMDPFEQKLAWFLMLNSDWSVEEAEAEVSDETVCAIWFAVSGPVIDGQRFALLGFLSQMIARQFNSLTASNGTVTRLTPSCDPSDLGILIPRDYRGSVLPLWRFQMQPSLFL